jgi:hypothetical protein
VSELVMDQRTDLSPPAIKRAVLGASLQHPAVVYPAALGVLGWIGAAVIVGSPVVVAAAVAGGGVAVAAFATNYFLRHDRIAGSYLADMRKRLAAERQAHIADLAEDLNEVKSAEGGKQLSRFVDKMETFQAILREKLSPQELTFARFSAIAEAVFLAGVDNLRAVHLALKALQAVDERYLRERLKKLEGPGAARAAQGEPSSELRGLRDQLAQAELLQARVRARLGENELALAELDRATAAIGDMRTGSERATLDMETAMAELARIAQRSAEYR